MNVLGIHHVTAVSARIAENLAFYTGTMGMRLVKKSVNQDDVSAYHLFYADAVASPGTDLTFFDWPTIDDNRPGPGSVGLTTLRVAGSALEFWEARLSAAGVVVVRDEDLSGRARLTFADPEGQRLALVDDTGMRGEVTPWDKMLPAEMATRGILGVNLDSARPDATRRVLTEFLGYRDVDGTRFVLDIGEAESEIVVTEPTGRSLGAVGAGGVHHVAFRVHNDLEIDMYREKLEAAGFRTSGFVNRYYFHSLYFREPGGVLFELATEGPGMASDEPMETLGERLALPPFLEPQREAIEAGLKPIGLPAYLKN